MKPTLNNEQVLALATELHKNHKRWSGAPYITHPITVASLASTYLKLINNKDDVDSIIQIAYLHDVLEDCPITSNWLLERSVDPVVVGYCQILNKNKYLNYSEYIVEVSKYFKSSVVKYFDLQHNLIELLPGQKRDKYLLAQALLQTSFDFKLPR